MAKAEVTELPVKVRDFTPEDVDRFAILLAEIDKKSEQADEIKKRLRKVVGPGGALDGKAFRIEISEAPEKHDKLDYRSLCLQYMKKAGVEAAAKVLKKMEDETEAEVIDYGTPRVTVVANPNYRP